MNDIAKLFYDIDEPYAAGLFEEPERSLFYRHCLGYARYYAHLRPKTYCAGDLIYPRIASDPNKRLYDSDRCAVNPQFAKTYAVNWEMLTAKSAKAAEILQGFYEISHHPGGWTHSCPNYKRILKEGLSGYRQRVLARPEDDFRAGLLALLDGLEENLHRSVEYLRTVGAPERLIAALEKVPFAPAESYYEALIGWNVIALFDGIDNLGCLDDGLGDYFDGEDLTEAIGQLYENIDTVGNWSVTIGMHPNEVTRQALAAIGKRRRPMTELMISENTPDDLWMQAIENLRDGGANPSFYNARAIHRMLHDHFPHIPQAELELFCGCGCTETTLQGISRVGGTDWDMPLTTVLRDYMDTHLETDATFDAFFEGLCTTVEEKTKTMLDVIAERYMYMRDYLPQPMRTLFTDDCIDKGKDFNGGGARYTWALGSDSGLINVIDSLLAIRELIYRKKKYTPAEFLQLLDAEDPMFFAELKKCPCYGVDDPDADEIATKFTTRAYMAYRNYPPVDFVEAFLLTEHQFDRYERVAKNVGPTPDGRKFGGATNDSIASLRGKAVKGPTSMLRSAAKLPQHLADGISVLNLTLQKHFSPQIMRTLIESYFEMGGIQVQVTCTSSEELRDAMCHPERHEDLVVRVGGYSEFFNRLTPELKAAVLERNIHEL